MGIRIHKVLGYGLTDFLGFDKDPRINSKFDENSADDKYDAKEFKKYFEKRYLELKEIKDKSGDVFATDYGLEWNYYFKDETYRQNISDGISQANHINNVNSGFYFYNSVRYCSYSTESDDPYAICFTTPIHSDWYRYDDIIDYYEHNCSIDDDNVYLLNRPIYPYDNYTYIKDGSIARNMHEVVQLVNYLKNNVYKSIPKTTIHSALCNNEELNTMCKDTIGVEYSECWNTVNCKIAPLVFEYLKFTGMFINDQEIRKLKPMILTFWS